MGQKPEPGEESNAEQGKKTSAVLGLQSFAERFGVRLSVSTSHVGSEMRSRGFLGFVCLVGVGSYSRPQSLSCEHITLLYLRFT